MLPESNKTSEEWLCSLLDDGGINAISVDKGTLGRHDMTITWFPFWNSLASLGLEYRSKQKEVFGNVSISSKLRERRSARAAMGF